MPTVVLCFLCYPIVVFIVFWMNQDARPNDPSWDSVRASSIPSLHHHNNSRLLSAHRCSLLGPRLSVSVSGSVWGQTCTDEEILQTTFDGWNSTYVLIVIVHIYHLAEYLLYYTKLSTTTKGVVDFSFIFLCSGNRTKAIKYYCRAKSVTFGISPHCLESFD